MSHTPGEWSVVEWGGTLYVRSKYAIVASRITTESDARLIASAPELLEELEKAHNELFGCGYLSIDEHDRREAVIRKARGL